MKHRFLILIAIFSLMACSSDDNSTSNEEAIDVDYTLEYTSTIPITTYVKVSGEDNVIYDYGSFTENQISTLIDKRGTIILSTYSQEADYVLSYKVTNNEDSSIVAKNDYACGLGDCRIEIEY